MSERSPFHHNLIRSLGGKAWVAGALGLDRGAVTRWHERGIPSKYWHRVIALAASANPPITVTAAELDATKPVVDAAPRPANEAPASVEAA